jgi:orotidine-5'-phosphate decarboxylase
MEVIMNESRICIALDFQTKEEVFEFLNKFNDEKLYVKVGMELFYGEGIEMVKAIKEMGHKIFLDLKLHDIPNTVKSAMKQLAKLDVDIVNVHASGSIAMMKAAIEGLEEGKVGDKRPLCIAVTCLTSLDQEVLDNELLIHEELPEVVLKWAENAKEAGLDGVVCSPLESKIIHENIGEDFITVTPGIRLATDNVNDQKRVTTPAMAKELTSTYIVVGRTITRSNDPLATYKEVYKQFQGE